MTSTEPSSHQDSFARHTFLEGLPLWSPAPDLLPPERQSNGLKIGDVGIIDGWGRFETIFNTCDPPDPALEGLYGFPPQFRRINPPRSIPPQPYPRYYIFSSPKTTWNRSREESRYVSRCTVDNSHVQTLYTARLSEDSAHILVPHGAQYFTVTQKDLRRFENLACNHWSEWSSFIEAYLGGRSVSLYLITGLCQTRSWALASFSKQSDDHQVIEVSCKLVIQDDRLVVSECEWTPSGRLDGKIGASNVNSQCDDNQTIFIQTITITPNGPELPTIQKYHNLLIEQADQSIGSATRHSAWTRWSTWLVSLFGRYYGNATTTETTHGQENSAAIRHVPDTTLPFHPSEIINQYLLKKYPLAKVAMTHDSIWMTMLAKGQLSNLQELERNVNNIVSEYYSIIFRDGAVYLEEKDTAHFDAGQGNSPTNLTDEIPRAGRIISSNNSHDEALDLEKIVAIHHDTLQHLSFGHPDQTTAMHDLGVSLHSRFKQLGAMSDLEEALVLERGVLKLHPNQANSMVYLARYLHSRFKWIGMLSDLNEAVNLGRNALQLYSRRCSRRATMVHNLAICLHSRFRRLGILSDLDEAVTLKHDMLAHLPPGHRRRASMMYSLADSLHSRFHQLGRLSDLDEAINLGHEALQLCPPGHPDRADAMHSLADSFHSSFHQFGRLSDLNEAVNLRREAFQLCPNRADVMHNLADSLHSRFHWLGMLSDLDEAVDLNYKDLLLYPPGHPDRANTMYSLASSLHSRFQQLGMLSDLDEALSLQLHALELCPQGHGNRALPLHRLAVFLHSRFKRLGVLADLDEAIVLEREVLQLYSLRHPDRAISMHGLAFSLHSRFQQLGMLSDLDEALSLQRDALDICPPGHPNRAIIIHSFAVSLHSRFQHLGMLFDLDKAVDLGREAVQLCPPEHLDRATVMLCLAVSLHSRFKELKILSDLNEALSIQRDASKLCLQGHFDRIPLLHNFALCFHSRFKELGIPSDLDEAVHLERDALQRCLRGHPGRVHSLASLAHCHHSRFGHLGALSDLDQAVSLGQEALELSPQGSPLRVQSLVNLASNLHARFKQSTSHSTDDLKESFSLYCQLADISQTVSSADLGSVRHWIEAAEEHEHGTIISAYETFLRLSIQHLAIVPSLPQHFVLFKQLTISMAVDAFSACVRRGNLANGAELLEQGRGVFWNQLIRLRFPLDEVIAAGDAGKNLASKLTQLASLLHRVPRDLGCEPEYQHDCAFHLKVQFQDVVDNIRKVPGLSRFFRPPLFWDLRIAAAGGPVIIVNASRCSCDALIILRYEEPVLVSLEITKARMSELSLDLSNLTLRARSNNVKTRRLAILLRELWETVVSPIVKILQDHHPCGSRIWWCPTAELSNLPLHAAGPLRKGQPMLSDFYVSSYTPTLTALIRARQPRPLDTSVYRPRFLLVKQAKTPGMQEIRSVNAEVSAISQCIESRVTLTSVQDEGATIANIAEELGKNEFVHLACHGIPNQKQPFESGLALYNGLLKVKDIMQYDLPNAQVAFLSASYTTVGDEESPDEAIHLAAAMLFAGFRSVIGTMWDLDDCESSSKVASKFYEYMLDETGRLDRTRAALALHRTMRSLPLSELPLDQQILYIHIGA